MSWHAPLHPAPIYPAPIYPAPLYPAPARFFPLPADRRFQRALQQVAQRWAGLLLVHHAIGTMLDVSLRGPSSAVPEQAAVAPPTDLTTLVAVGQRVLVRPHLEVWYRSGMVVRIAGGACEVRFDDGRLLRAVTLQQLVLPDGTAYVVLAHIGMAYNSRCCLTARPI